MANQITFDNIDFVRASFSNTQSIAGVPFKMNPIAEGLRLEAEMKGGGLGAVLGIAIAIAVPFIAPAVAGAVFGSSVMAGAISGTLASAATGAVLGGLGAKLTGGDWRQGMLMGGIGGGLTQGMGGFGSTNNPLFGNATTANAGFFGPTGTVTPAGQGQTGWFGASPTTTAVDPTLANPNANSIMSGTNTSTTTTPQSAADKLSSTATPPPPPPGQPPVGSPSAPTVDSAWSRFTGPAGPAPSPYVMNADGSYVLDAAGKAVVNPESAKYVAATNMAKDRLVNASLSAGIPAATNLIATYAMKGDQDKRMEQYQKELETLKATDQKAYEAKLAEVQSYIQSAKNINPAYFGQQNANLANTQGTRRLAESFREMPMAGLRNAGYTSGERRRADIGLSQNVGTAYDRGYGQGQQMQNTMLERGIAMYPNAPTRYLDVANRMENMYGNMQASTNARAAGLADTAGRFTSQYLVKV